MWSDTIHSSETRLLDSAAAGAFGAEPGAVDRWFHAASRLTLLGRAVDWRKEYS